MVALHRVAPLTFAAFACNAAAISPSDGRGDEVRVHDAGHAGASDSGGARFPVEIGIPDEITSSMFVNLDDDGDVRIQDGGQGGTHALVALRFRGLGQWIYYNVSIENLEGEGEVITPDLVRPRPTLCDDERFECRISPILVVIGGLAERSEWDGLHVEIRASVSNEDGEAGDATTRAYLRR